MNAVVKLSTKAAENRQATIERLAQEIDTNKRVELNAQRLRREAEEQLCALLGVEPGHSITEATPNYKIKVDARVTRSWDTDVLSAIYPKIPEAIASRLIRMKYEVVARELAFIEANEPELFALISTAVETKPSKPTVSVTHKE